jgi:serine/threonine-protein kinase RsbT
VIIDTEKPQLSKHFEIEPRDFVHAGEASLQVQRVLRTIGFEADLIRRASVCAYEAEMNVVMYGGKGELALEINTEEIILEVSDDGNGIEDIEAAFREGFSTALPEFREMGFGAGMGLPNIRKNADFMNVQSEPGKGTRLNIHFRLSKVT